MFWFNLERKVVVLAIDVSGFVVVVVVNGHQMGRRASCLVVIRQMVRSMCIRPHEPQDTYSNHVRYRLYVTGCTLQAVRYRLYVTAVRYSCTLQAAHCRLCVTAVRYSCTLQLYVTAVCYSCTLQLYVTAVHLQLYVTA